MARRRRLLLVALLAGLAAALLHLSYTLYPHYDSSRPLVSLGLLFSFCAGYAAMMAALALMFGPAPEASP